MNLAIEIENLSKEYPGRVALNNVSFQVKKGSVHGFLGPNGAGKSTLMKIVTGLIPETSGSFKVHGQVGFLPENPPVYPHMAVEDYLEFVFKIYSSGNLNQKECIEEVMTKTGLLDVRKRLIGNLSKGYQQRVGIAQAIIHRPEIIILDEPTVGLDPVAIAEIRQLITELKKDHTILFSSHQLYEVGQLCSEVTLINEGEIVVSGELDKILGSLNSNKIIGATVQYFDQQLAERMKGYAAISNVEIKHDTEKNLYHLRIFTKVEKDLRPEIARFLVAPEIGLLEFIEEKGELEDLFKRI